LARRRPTLERGRPDAAWVSRLARSSLARAGRFATQIANDAEFNSALEERLSAGGRSNYVQIAAPFELYSLVRLLRPRQVVEVGVSAGVSSAYLLKGLSDNGGGGTLHSIDLPEKQIGKTFCWKRQAHWALPAGRSTGWAVPTSLKTNWDLRLGKSGDLLPDLTRELRSVGVFLYDVPYRIEEAKAEFAAVDPRLHRGSVSIADNCLVPIKWWARRRAARVYTRRGSGLRGFSVP
jgi:hypothetical protein